MQGKVYIVDEDVKAREFLYELISSAGFAAVTIPRGKEALERLKNDRAGAIILEDVPGEFSGVNLLQKIREIDKDVKLIFLGENPQPENRIPQLKLSHVSAYLKKDFQNPEFIQRILSVLKSENIPVSSRLPKLGSVLIVDDEVENRDMVASYLKRRGFEADTAASGEECLDKIKQRSFDVILLDITMGGMDGLLTLKRIKKIAPDQKVLMVSALHHQDVLNEARSIGANDYLVKPFNLETLFSRLYDALFSNNQLP